MNTDKHRWNKASGALCFVALLTAVLGLTSCGPAAQTKEPLFWNAGELTFSVSTPGGTINVGDRYDVTFTAIYPTNGVVTFPEIGREKDVVVVNREWQELPFEPNAGHKKEQVKYTITSFRLGDHVICEKPVIYQHDGITETNAVPETTVKVVSSLDETTTSEIVDIQPVHKLPTRIPIWVWVIPGAVLIAFLIGLIVSKLWKNRETLIPAPPPIPPHVIAFKALDALKNKGLLENDECAPFYTELSMILRTYLDGRFSLNATDETTEEIVDELSRSPELNADQQHILRDFMTQADMVKFAKGRPDRSTMESAFATTKQFVEQTAEYPISNKEPQNAEG